MRAIGLFFKGIFYTILGAIGLVLAIMLIFNSTKAIIYKEYFSLKEDIIEAPGLRYGSNPEGIAISNDGSIILTVANINNSASGLYIINKDNSTSKYYSLEYEGMALLNISGVAVSDEEIYLANSDNYIYTIPLKSALAMEDGSTINLASRLELNNSIEFIYIRDSYIYVGHKKDLVIAKYSLSDLKKPILSYRVGKAINGIAILEDGSILLSDGEFLRDSYFSIYNKDSFKEDGAYNASPLYNLGSPIRSIKAPALAKGVAYNKGKAYTLFESACNKYIFGKFFFAYDLVAIEIE